MAETCTLPSWAAWNHVSTATEQILVLLCHSGIPKVTNKCLKCLSLSKQEVERSNPFHLELWYPSASKWQMILLHVKHAGVSGLCTRAIKTWKCQWHFQASARSSPTFLGNSKNSPGWYIQAPIFQHKLSGEILNLHQEIRWIILLSLLLLHGESLGWKWNCGYTFPNGL